LNFRCLAVDLPGFGKSICTDQRGFSIHECAILVSQLIRRLDLGPVFLVGHDVGGAIAEICSTRAESTVRGVVLVNAASVISSLPSLQFGWWGLAARWRLDTLLRESTLTNRQLFESLQRSLKQSDRRGALARAWREFERSWPSPEEQRAWKASLRHAGKPTLLLWGSHETLNSREVAFELLRELREVAYFEREPCGHWPPLEAPVWASVKIRDFAFVEVASRRLML